MYYKVKEGSGKNATGDLYEKKEKPETKKKKL